MEKIGLLYRVSSKPQETDGGGLEVQKRMGEKMSEKLGLLGVEFNEGVYKDGKRNGVWKDYGDWLGNYVGGEGNYLKGEKVGEWKYYFEPWLNKGNIFDTEVYQTRLDSIP